MCRALWLPWKRLGVQIFASTGRRHLPHTHRCGQTYQMTGMCEKYIASANMRLKPG